MDLQNCRTATNACIADILGRIFFFFFFFFFFCTIFESDVAAVEEVVPSTLVVTGVHLSSICLASYLCAPLLLMHHRVLNFL